MEICKERFEAFLFSLPPDAEYCYSDSSNCVICEFYKSQGYTALAGSRDVDLFLIIRGSPG